MVASPIRFFPISSSAFLHSVFSVTLWLILFTPAAQGQKKTADLKAPEPGYVFPAGGKVGTTIDVHLGGYDWTPDVQLFVLDPRVKLQLAGEQGPVLVPPPPYWFGPKAYLTAAPLPRERSAKFTIPADQPAGPIRWAVASASGAGLKTGIFWVGGEPEVTEEKPTKLAQKLPALPVTVNGKLSKVEEVDRYRFTVPKDGPVSLEVFARRLGVNMNAPSPSAMRGGRSWPMGSIPTATISPSPSGRPRVPSTPRASTTSISGVISRSCTVSR